MEGERGEESVTDELLDVQNLLHESLLAEVVEVILDLLSFLFRQPFALDVIILEYLHDFALNGIHQEFV